MEILFQDPGIVVCRKEAGMDSEHDVPQALKAALGGEIFPVHRLDRGTAGLMVYARSKQAAAALSRAMPMGPFKKNTWPLSTAAHRKRAPGRICFLRTAGRIRSLWSSVPGPGSGPQSCAIR